MVYAWRGWRRRANELGMRRGNEKNPDFNKGKRGPVLPAPKGKRRITIRLDDDILDWFLQQVDEAGGGNYQTLINNALRDYIAHAREPLEQILRRVVREEIRRAS